MAERVYIAIDLKSFYASVECMARGLDPLTTHLVVADTARTEKTICLAVSPSLRTYGIPGRARLFEVVQKVRELNALRLTRARRQSFAGESTDADELAAHPELAITYITARPRMAHYIAASSRIYSIYLRYIAPEDIHAYSIDEVFIDATDYLPLYGLNARELAMKMILEVLRETGITATAGIGTNLYLAKVAMDIRAKHIPADANGVRIAELDEMRYRQLLWDHQPLTDFWRIGRGYAKKLAKVGLYTMGDIARCSIGKAGEFHNEDLLYKLFGVNAELLIDHAWGWEPCTMADIKAYRPASSSISSGQVLQSPYPAAKAHLVVCEMAEQLAMDLFEKQLTTDQLVLTVGYDTTSLPAAARTPAYRQAGNRGQSAAQAHSAAGEAESVEVTIDRYGRAIPKHAHSTVNLPQPTSSVSQIVDALSDLYQRIVNPDFTVRRLTLCANHILPECPLAAQTFRSIGADHAERSSLSMCSILQAGHPYASAGLTPSADHAQTAQDTAAALAGQGAEQGEQLDLFGFVADGKDIFGRDAAETQRQKEASAAALENERRIQQSLLAIKQKFGKNAVIKGRDLEDGATAMQRNDQIGGHKA